MMKKPNSKKFSRSRIKILVRLSKEIILEYGFVYFIKTAIYELKRQGLDIFKESDFPNLTNLDQETEYALWQQKHDLSQNDELIIKKTIRDLKIKPKFSLILFDNLQDISSSKLNKSLNSIYNQLYENWEIILMNKSDKIDGFQELESPPTNQIKKSNDKSLNQVLFQTDGQYFGFLKIGDILTQDALFQIALTLNEKPEAEIIYTDEDLLNSNDKRTKPFFKPDWCPYLFFSMNYLGTFCFIKKQTYEKAGGLLHGINENKIYSFLLKCTESTNKIIHISLPLISSQKSKKKQSDYDEIKTGISQSLKRRGIGGIVEDGILPNTFRVKFPLKIEPKVSIIIPTKDLLWHLKKCINGIKNKTDYKNWEIIIIDNNSVLNETKSYLSSLPYKVIKFDSSFNFSKINNMAVSEASGEFLLFLNDDTEPLNSNWLTELVSICQQSDVGAVGAKLVRINDSIQHSGIVFLKNGYGFHIHEGLSSKTEEYHGFANVIREYSAVTAACLLTKKELFEKVGMFDETFDLYYGDADLCFKFSKLGYKIIYTPYAYLIHYGSTKTQKTQTVVIAVENHYHFLKKWPALKSGDPCYNSNLGVNFCID